MKKLIPLLFIVFFACELFSGYWVDPMIVNPDLISFFWSNHDMTWDSTGRVWVSWTTDTSFSYYDWSKVKSCYYNGSKWSNPYHISQGLDTTWWNLNCYNVMTTDVNGKAWCLWYYGHFPTSKNTCENNQEDWAIEYSLFANGAWSEPCVAESTIGSYIRDTITDSLGRIWVGWMEQTPYPCYANLYSTFYDGYLWQRATMIYYCFWIDGPYFVAESTGVGAVWSYEEYPWVDATNYGLIYAHNFGEGWEGYKTLDYDTTSELLSPSTAMDSSGRLWVVWQKFAQSNWCLCANFRESGVWSNLKIVPSISDADFSAPCIKTDGYGKTWLACQTNREGTHHIYVSYLEDTSFITFQQISSQPGYDPKLECDVMGNIWAVWYGNDRKIYASFYRRDTNPPRVTVIKPNGGEVFNFGETDTIKWSAEDDDTIVWVNIYFSSDGGNTYKLVSEFEKNDSNYEWTIPDVTSNNCLVEITAIDKGYNAISDESDSFFTILGTGIYEEQEKLVKEQNVKFQVFPNPFRDRVEIRLMMEDERWEMEGISLRIYNVTGCLVKEFSLPTTYSILPTVISWDGRNNAGEKVTSGVYFLRFNTGDYKETRQVLLLR
jgi:hypothetical protein